MSHDCLLSLLDLKVCNDMFVIELAVMTNFKFNLIHAIFDFHYIKNNLDHIAVT